MEPAARGIHERMRGTPVDGNPYPVDSDAWKEWRRGWLVSSTGARLPRLEVDADQPTPVSSPIEL